MLVLSEVYRLRLCQQVLSREYKEAEVAARHNDACLSLFHLSKEEYTSFFTQLYEENISRMSSPTASNAPAPPQYPSLKKDIVDTWNQLYYGSELEYAESSKSIIGISRFEWLEYYFTNLSEVNTAKKAQIDHTNFIFWTHLSYLHRPSFIPDGIAGRSLNLEAEYKLKLNPAKRPNKHWTSDLSGSPNSVLHIS